MNNTLFICEECHVVLAFDTREIEKHQLQPVEEKMCPVCKSWRNLCKLE